MFLLRRLTNVSHQFFSSYSGSGLSLNEVSVPGYSSTGETVTLKCDFDLEGDQLYNVKWYKGTKEFFRYVPADNPPMQVFELPGVSVDVRQII